jgi:hypothetical protein
MGQLPAGKDKLSPDQFLLKWVNYLLEKVAVTYSISHEMGHLPAGEGKLPTEQLLLRWVNCQLEKVSFHRISCSSDGSTSSWRR